jgi:hypothetical protein
MMKIALTFLAISKRMVSLLILINIAMLMGCSSVPQKDANKNLFQQALALQNSKSTPSKSHGDGNIQWIFETEQFQPSDQQRQALFLWLAQLQDYSNNPVLLRLGPDWLSSYKRGNAIRKMIPRGIVIEQQFDTRLVKHKVIFSLKNSLNNMHSNPNQAVSHAERFE